MMDKIQRAHIFSSFDALKGFRELLKEKERIVVPKRILSEDDLEILDKKIHQIEKGMIITVIYFDNGDYIKKTGIVSKIRLEERYIQIIKTKILLKNIVDIQYDDLKNIDYYNF